jgi:hypothetical protein
MAQVVEYLPKQSWSPEFKPQYHQKNKKKKNWIAAITHKIFFTLKILKLEKSQIVTYSNIFLVIVFKPKTRMKTVKLFH